MSFDTYLIFIYIYFVAQTGLLKGLDDQHMEGKAYRLPNEIKTVLKQRGREAIIGQRTESDESQDSC